MTRKELLNDMKFKNKCYTYGLDYEDFDIVDDVIILSSPKKNIKFLLDEHYNIINIYNLNDTIYKYFSSDEIIKDAKRRYETLIIRLPYPFQNYSIKQIVEIANRVSIHNTNHGHSSNMFVNGELVTNEQDDIYVSLLSYIKFLGKQIEQYYMNLYQMKMMDFNYYDIYEYIKKIMTNINECIDNNIEQNKRPFPIDIINYLGQNRNIIEENEQELYNIINLLLKDKGLKINEENYKKIKETNSNIIDLSESADKLVKILTISEEEVDARYENINRTFEVNKIDLQSWLSPNKQLIKE